MAQQTYLTPQALQFALKQSAMLIQLGSPPGLRDHGSPIRIAAFAQQTPHKGSWNAVRFDWSKEPDRVATFNPEGSSCRNFHWAS